MQIVYLYCVTNTVNGKRYVGQTRHPLPVRFRQHCYDAHRPHCRRGLARAIRKYGEEAFIIEQLCAVTSVQAANRLERRFIQFFNTLSIGYNMLPGGVGKCSGGNPNFKTDSWRKFISEKLKKRWSDPLSREKMIVGRWGSGPRKERYRPATLPNEIRSSRIAEANRRRSKTYFFISPEGASFSTSSLGEFCRQHGLDPTCMSRVSTGVYGHHKRWRRNLACRAL